jgi:RNA polymerase sigma factor (sigma-70 family)
VVATQKTLSESALGGHVYVMMIDDMTLVREFAASHSESAFAGLVERHIGLVHSSALRQSGDHQLAEDISQAVFIILARKAPSLGSKTVLSAWLYRTTRYATADALKARRRRQAHDQEAYMQSTLNEPDSDAWAQLAPVLDDALAELGETDRTALVLRFFENKTAREIAETLRMEEGAAQKRVTRALEKLRSLFVKRGVTLTAAAIAGAVGANAVQAAPVGLVVTISATAAKGVAVTATVTALVKGTMHMMTWIKLKLAVGVGLGVLLAGSVATMALIEKPSEAPTAPPTGSHAGVTFFSMLEGTPIVANAVFEKELFMDGIPAGARKQTFAILADGDNYRLSTGGTREGKFEGVSWQQLNGNLTLFDPKANKQGGNSGGTVEGESTCRMTVDLFLALGIRQMLPGSAVWDPDKHRFTAKTRDGKNLVVETTLENGVPVAAYLLTDDGQRSVRIQFIYSAGFYGGQVPIEFTAYWIKPGATDEQSPKLKIYSIRVRALEISDEHLDSDLLDPTQLAGTSTTFSYSNNILYWTKRNGEVSRVLTLEEGKKETERLKAIIRKK